ncbi:TMEM175 family protein [Herbaspirillum seropedicae]|uniref:TMEM175 family protein n=1 Tax=Herbaspirillum seropedicae TaxID=964 RepID=UPI00084816CF|nr:TMEM175 family protein [Herbaspirillum seropedicae]AON56886.1 integral membrane protein [Herbaspirillum seropedicae]MDR6398227.1 putative membrane protein [Herbaspirillum seropedicae]
MNKSRVEAFSDGVIAIAITIMVLELHTPDSASLDALLSLAPQILSYLLSFIYVGIYWLNHHHLLSMAERVDRSVLLANLNLLFWLSLIPFVTGWIAGHHRDSLPVASYGVVLLMCSVSFLWLKLTLRDAVKDHPLAATAIGNSRKNKWSILLYGMAIASSFWLPLGASLLYVILALLWFIPDRRFSKLLQN